MGIPVLIIGKSGSGKSTSLRNFKADEVGILNVAGKPLPFRNKNKLKMVNNANYQTIHKCLKTNKLKCYVIDDSQYLMAFESFENAQVVGYNKFTNMAVNFYDAIRAVQNTTPDTIVYFLHHTDVDDNGNIKPKTIGKMLDQQLTVEGLFSIVIGCAYIPEKRHCFITQTNGADVYKTPMDMFDEMYIDNDLKAVDTAIRKYYDFEEVTRNAETE